MRPRILTWGLGLYVHCARIERRLNRAHPITSLADRTFWRVTATHQAHTRRVEGLKDSDKALDPHPQGIP